jgi:hypothetical protein
MIDYTLLFTPLIITLIPILVALSKQIIPARYAVLYPMLATVLGPVLDYASTWLSAQPANPGRGLLMGMAAVALREIVDQLRKLPKNSC